MLQIKNKNKLIAGIALAEVLVVLGLVGAISFFAVDFISASKKSQSKIEFDSDVTLINNGIIAALADEATCLEALGKTDEPTQIGKFAIGISNGNSAVGIAKFHLSGISPNGQLTVSYQNKKIINASGNTFDKIINLYFEGVPGNLTKCRAPQRWKNGIWSLGDGNDIFYKGGIQIGDETQSTNLCDRASVEGTIRYNRSKSALEYCVNPGTGFDWRLIKTRCRDVVSQNSQKDQLVEAIAKCSSDEELTGAYGSCSAGDSDNLYLISTEPNYIPNVGSALQQCGHLHLEQFASAKITITCCR